jgi:hypothetical protein
MSGIGKNGTPDYYYEGPCGALWVEYKVVPNDLTKMQQRWVERAWNNGQQVWVAKLDPRNLMIRVIHAGGVNPMLTFDDFVDEIVETVLCQRTKS